MPADRLPTACPPPAPCVCAPTRSREKVQLTGEVLHAAKVIGRAKARIQEAVRMCDDTPGLTPIAAHKFDARVGGSHACMRAWQAWGWVRARACARAWVHGRVWGGCVARSCSGAGAHVRARAAMRT